MTILKIQSTKKNEKGIALLFTLIMLSLLMMLALSFALDSMFEQKAAYNSASTSSAAFLDQSQLKQVLLLMKAGEANFDGGRLYSHDFYSNTDTDMLVDRLPVDGVLAADDGCLDPTVKVNWNYTKDADGKIIGRTAFVVIPEDKIPLDSLVDGREVSDTLSVTCLYPRHNEKDDTETRIGKYVSEINVRAAIPAVNDNISTITETLNWKSDPYPPSTPVLGFDNGKYTGNWSSFSSLFSTINAEITPDLSSDDKTEFEDKLTLDIAKDAEAFWAEATSGDKEIGTDELYKRFDLTRTDWDTANNAADIDFIENKILLDSDSDGVPDLSMEQWSDTDSDSDTNSKGLPWLALFGYKTDGTPYTLTELDNSTFSSVVAHRRQIAANLKDYSDSDSRPTSDIDPSTWSTLPSPAGYVHPTYTGNEKTPYIDKVGMRISTSQDGTGSGPYTVWANVIISPAVSLVNMYDVDYDDPLTVKIEGSITIDINVDGVTGYVSKTQDFNCSININPWEWKNPGYSVFRMDSSITPFETASQSVTGGNKKVTFEVKQINFTKIVLVNGTVGYDYTKNLVANYPSPSPAVELNNGAGYRHFWYGFAAQDPRQNLNGTTIPTGATAADADWLILTPDETLNAEDVLSVDSSGYGAPNAANSSNGTGGDNTEAPTAGPDLETSTDPASDISTAYIRNAPMESPWELGFIHRGVKWQTINLKTYDTSKAFQLATAQINGKDYIPGGGDYANGDANILDQIKMTASSKSPQKINLNSTENATFYALFSKVKLGCDINRGDSALNHMTVKSIAGLETTTTGKEIDVTSSAPTVYTIMRDAIKSKFASPDITNYTNLTRAAIASGTNILISADATEPDPSITLSATGKTDAAQEELIGKIVNLTKVGGSSGNFIIIVLSQTIKDIGGDVTDINISRTSADGLATHAVPCRLGRFDLVASDGNPSTLLDSDWKKNLYGDEIIGEQKILVNVTINVDKTITINSFQYVD